MCGSALKVGSTQLCRTSLYDVAVRSPFTGGKRPRPGPALRCLCSMKSRSVEFGEEDVLLTAAWTLCMPCNFLLYCLNIQTWIKKKKTTTGFYQKKPILLCAFIRHSIPARPLFFLYLERITKVRLKRKSRMRPSRPASLPVWRRNFICVCSDCCCSTKSTVWGLSCVSYCTGARGQNRKR